MLDASAKLLFSAISLNRELARHQLWTLMVDKNTPLINELLEQIGQHPEFETWRQKGKLPTDR